MMLERRAADERRQDLDADRAEAGRRTDVDAVDDPEVDDGEHRELRVHDLGECRADGRLVDGAGVAAGSRGRRRSPPDRARATPIWIPASLTRSLPGRPADRA